MTIADSVYADWIRQFDWSDERDLERARHFLPTLQCSPRIDVVMPVYDPPESFLGEAIESVRRQVYQNWSLCIADDGSREASTIRILERAERADERIRVHRAPVNGGIASATNAAISLGTGEIVAFLDHDDVIPPHALLLVAHRFERSPDANIIYSDFDFLNDVGARTNPFFKPDYDHETHLALNILSHLTVYRRSLLDRVGGLRDGFPGSEDYDVGLRVVEQVSASTIHHIPHVLYHWRMAKSSFSRTRLNTAIDSARRAVREHCERKGFAVTIGGTPRSLIWNRVRILPSSPPSVTLAVEARTAAATADALERLVGATDYSPLSVAPASLRDLPSLAEFRNQVVRSATTDLVVFVGGSLLPRSREWLVEMTSHFASRSCAVVGTRTIGKDGRIQQSGTLLGVRDSNASLPFGRAFHGVSVDDPSYFGRDEMAQSASVVSGGVFLVRKSTVGEVGGFDERYSDRSCLDIDFCLRAGQRGFRVVFDPHAAFADLAEAIQEPASTELLRRAWGAALDHDPYYNPNLTNQKTDFSLALPPRATFPWRSER
jgi:O-antigen biosynthesis protein